MKEGKKAREPYMSNRATAAETAAVGGAMTASGIAGSYGLDRMLERKGIKSPGKALLSEVKRTWNRGSKTSFNPVHVPYVAGKIASRSLKTVGIPLAAYGAFNAVKPGEKVVRINLKNDVIRPSLRATAGLHSEVNAKNPIRAHRDRELLRKSQLTDKERTRLSRRKQQGRYLSLTAGTLGLGALALRAPEIARAATRIPKVGNLRSLKRLASYDAPSTKASNALGIAAIGLGSVGSFNYAAQQKLERKQVAKAMTSRELDKKSMDMYVSLFPRPKLKKGEPKKEYHKRLGEWNHIGNTYAASQRHARKEKAAQPYRLARIKRGPYLDGGQRSLPERRAYAMTKSFSKGLPSIARGSGYQKLTDPKAQEFLRRRMSVHNKGRDDAAQIAEMRNGYQISGRRTQRWAGGSKRKRRVNIRPIADAPLETGPKLGWDGAQAMPPKLVSRKVHRWEDEYADGSRSVTNMEEGKPTYYIRSKIGKRDGVIERGKSRYRDKELRQARTRRNDAADNAMFSGSALAASTSPAMLSLYNKGIKRVKRNPDGLIRKYPVLSHLNPVKVPKSKIIRGRLRMLGLAGVAPGRIGRVARNPFAIAGASLAVGGPVHYRNQKEYRSAKNNLKELREKRRETAVGKRDDRFLREHRLRISPEAEKGYKYLRRGRNEAVRNSSLTGWAAGLSAGLGVHALRRGSKGLAAVGGATAALVGSSSVHEGRRAARWNSKMGKIKAKGRERALAGEYGKDRQWTVPVGKTYVGGGVYRSLSSLSPRARMVIADKLTKTGLGSSPQQRRADQLRGVSSKEPYNPWGVGEHTDPIVESGRKSFALSMKRARRGNATPTSVSGLSIDARMPAGVRSVVERQASNLKIKGPTTVRWNKEKRAKEGQFPNFTVDSPGPTGRGRSVVLSAVGARGADPKTIRHELEHAVGGSRKGRLTSLKLRKRPNRSIQNEEARADAASMTVGGGKRRLATWYPHIFGEKSHYSRRFREITGQKALPHSTETYRRNTANWNPEYKELLSGRENKGFFYSQAKQAKKEAKLTPDRDSKLLAEDYRRLGRVQERDSRRALEDAGASERLKNRADFFSKGLFPVPRPKLSMRPRRNSVRSSYTGTSRLGHKFTVSGSVR